MALNLTDVKSLVNSVKTNLFYGEDKVLRIKRLNEVLLEISEGFYIRKFPTTNAFLSGTSPGNTEYIECSITDVQDDEIDITSALNLATELELNGEVYKISTWYRPRIETKEFIIRLQSTGQAVS